MCEYDRNGAAQETLSTAAKKFLPLFGVHRSPHGWSDMLRIVLAAQLAIRADYYYVTQRSRLPIAGWWTGWPSQGTGRESRKRNQVP
jgi:hypothetical protein